MAVMEIENLTGNQMRKYKWRDGFRIKGNAQVIGETLETLRVKNKGFLDAKLVVKEASNKKSVLHGVFEWNDSKAARKWREDQAAKLIASLTVITEQAPDSPVRAFVSLREGQNTVSPYTDITSAMLNEKFRQIVLRNALHEADSFAKKYSALTELSNVFQAIVKAKNQHLTKIKVA